MFLAQSSEQKNAKNAPMMVERIPRQNVTKSWNNGEGISCQFRFQKHGLDVLQSSLYGFCKVNILIIKCRKSHHHQTQQCYHKGLKGIAAFIFCLDLDFSFSGAFHDFFQIQGNGRARMQYFFRHYKITFLILLDTPSMTSTSTTMESTTRLAEEKSNRL